MAKKSVIDAFSKEDQSHLDEHLHAIAHRYAQVAARDEEAVFPYAKYLLRRLGELILLDSKANTTFVEVVSTLGQSAGSNVIDAVRKQVSSGKPDWDGIGRALGISSAEARQRFGQA